MSEAAEIRGSMLAQTWVNGIAAAVVVAALVKAWRSTHPGKKEAAKPEANAPKTPPGVHRMRDHRPWALLRNEAEIARRRGDRPWTPNPETHEGSGADQSAS
jgi:hypothetical protein